MLKIITTEKKKKWEFGEWHTYSMIFEIIRFFYLKTKYVNYHKNISQDINLQTIIVFTVENLSKNSF